MQKKRTSLTAKLMAGFMVLSSVSILNVPLGSTDVKAVGASATTSESGLTVQIIDPVITDVSGVVTVTALVDGQYMPVNAWLVQDDIEQISESVEVVNGVVNFNVDTRDITNGFHKWTVFADDVGANIGSADIEVLVDNTNTPPRDTVAPSQPTNLTGTSQNRRITLNWLASTDNVGVAKYEVYWNGMHLTDVTGTTYTDGALALTEGKSYSYYVKAVDAEGNKSVASNTVNVVLSDVTKPTTPTGVTGTSPSRGTVVLKWAASSDNVGVSRYNVYKGTTKIATVSGTTLTHTVRNLKSGTTFNYYVQAVDAAGNVSAKSTGVSVRTR